MTGTGYSLTQSMKLGQTMAPQMRQSLKMLQMTSLALRAELQHQMELNPVIEEVRSPLERQMSSALPEEHAEEARARLAELKGELAAQEAARAIEETP